MLDSYFHTHVSPRFLAKERLYPPNSTSWPVLGSCAEAPEDRGPGCFGGNRSVQFVPSHSQVSEKSVVRQVETRPLLGHLGGREVNCHATLRDLRPALRDFR